MAIFHTAKRAFGGLLLAGDVGAAIAATAMAGRVILDPVTAPRGAAAHIADAEGRPWRLPAA